MLLNKIRKLGFNLLDFITGGGVNKHFKEIKNVLDKHNLYGIIAPNQISLNKLLTHAVETTEFYNPFKEFKSVQDFPVIKKNIVQDNFEKFRSSIYLNKKFHKVSTSGSTGAPFILYQDMNKRKRNMADVIYYFDKVGHEIGNRLYELEVWRTHNKKGRVKSLMQNVFQFDVSKLDDNRILQFLQILQNDKKTKTFLGFASAYETICHYIDRNRKSLDLNFEVKAIIANAEYLNDYTRESMRINFKAPVYSRYSNEEIGIIAQQIVGSNDDFLINWASYYVELLEFNSDVPVERGNPGRIVVTDLFNYCMPLIRFDTGDVGVFAHTDNDKLPNFKQVEGRKMDLIYDTSGNLVSSFVVYTLFYNYYNLLKQYQFIQVDKKEYIIKLNLNQDNFEFKTALIKAVKSEFGTDAIVKIQYVDEIPPLASGKRKKVMSLYTKEKSGSI